MCAGKRILAASAVVALGVGCWPAGAQQARVYTTADYAQAEKFMNYNVNPLVYHGVERATWMADGRFWYRDSGPNGATYMVVDPAKKSKGPAFDHGKLAVALAAALPGRSFKAGELQLNELELTDGDRTLAVTVGGAKVNCSLGNTVICAAAPGAQTGRRGARGGGGAKPMAVLSPDKTKSAFIRDNNLWVTDVASGAETKLTTDGVKDFGYATDNAGWSHSASPVLLWSPDSKKIATFQQDQRKVGYAYLVPVTNSHPAMEAWKYPMVGDKDITMIERVVIDVPTANVVRFKMPQDQHRSTLCDDIACRGGWDDVQFSEDGTHVAFVSSSRDHKQVWLRVADTATGEVREVMNEATPKFYESGNGKVNWKYLPKSNEVLWFSERDNWGQLYLYDLTTGQLKNQITKGDGNVTQVLRVDAKARVIYFLGVGKEQGRDPYFQHFYRVNFDGTGMKLLTSGEC